MPDFSTDHDADHGRYTASLDGVPIGVAEYRDTEEGRVFTHTEVDPAEQGHGYATRLVRAALDDTLDAGITPIAQCAMVRNFIAEHPDYARPRAR